MGFNEEPRTNEEGQIVTLHSPQAGPATVIVFDKIVIVTREYGKSAERGYPHAIRIPFALYGDESIQWSTFVETDPHILSFEGLRRQNENKITDLLDIFSLRDSFLKGFKERGGNLGNPLDADEKNLQTLVNGLNILLPNRPFEAVIELKERLRKVRDENGNEVFGDDGKPSMQPGFPEVNFVKLGRYGCGIIPENKGKPAPQVSTKSFVNPARAIGSPVPVTGDSAGFGA